MLNREAANINLTLPLFTEVPVPSGILCFHFNNSNEINNKKKKSIHLSQAM